MKKQEICANRVANNTIDIYLVYLEFKLKLLYIITLKADFIIKYLI